MNPLLIIVPVGIGVAAYMLLKPSGVTPPPGVPAAGSGGVRYQSYMQQLQAAMLGYQAGAAFGDTADVAGTTKATISTIVQMAQADLQLATITTTDMANIQRQANAYLAQVK